jgi:anti-sigma regulatory factor (Ser/Thr protein kinase)
LSAPAPAAVSPAIRLAWRHAAADLDALPRSVPTARHLVRLVLGSWGLDDSIGITELIVSELVTNAVRASEAAGMPVVRLRLTRRIDALRIDVWDRGEPLPQYRPDGRLDDSGGRGLLIVDSLADVWGTEAADDGGKFVFTVLAR